MRRRSGEEQGVAIGLGGRGRSHAYPSARTAPVLDHDRLAEHPGDPVADQTRDDIGVPARDIRNNQMDRLGRIALLRGGELRCSERHRKRGGLQGRRGCCK